MPAPRKFIPGRHMTPGEVMEMIAAHTGPDAYVYITKWNKPAHLGFISSLRARTLAKLIAGGHVYTAEINPAYAAKQQGEKSNGN